MVCLAKNQGQILPLKTISRREGISFDYLEKILSKLEKAKLIQSKKGVQGGYLLIKKPSQIRAGQIVQALEGDVSLVKCIAGRQNFCPRKNKCLTKKFWQKIQDALYKSFNSLTLADLIKK